MRNSPRAKWLKGSPLLLGTLFVLLLIVTAVIPFNLQISDWLYMRLEAPRLAQEFGFEPQLVEVSNGHTKFSVFMLARVDPNGRLGRAGIVSGDVPVGYPHGMVSFLETLEGARQRGQEVQLQVVSANEFFESETAMRRVRLSPGPVQ
ncbi:MAG: hypothetical protein AB7G12_09645 [Thermoanaerobaculia bacterium]